jgi:hypothetical protein
MLTMQGQPHIAQTLQILIKLLPVLPEVIEIGNHVPNQLGVNVRKCPIKCGQQAAEETATA